MFKDNLLFESIFSNFYMYITGYVKPLILLLQLYMYIFRVYSGGTQGPQATNFCLWVTVKTYCLHKVQVPCTPDFIVRSLWALYVSSKSTVMILDAMYMYTEMILLL